MMVVHVCSAGSSNSSAGGSDSSAGGSVSSAGGSDSRVQEVVIVVQVLVVRVSDYGAEAHVSVRDVYVSVTGFQMRLTECV